RHPSFRSPLRSRGRHFLSPTGLRYARPVLCVCARACLCRSLRFSASAGRAHGTQSSPTQGVWVPLSPFAPPEVLFFRPIERCATVRQSHTPPHLPIRPTTTIGVFFIHTHTRLPPPLPPSLPPLSCPALRPRHSWAPGYSG
ncbi:hypothetical protein IOCL3481_000400800, partial [Leishmania shawi]